MEGPKLGEEQIVIPKVPENVLKIRKERLKEREQEGRKKRIEVLKKKREIRKQHNFVTPQKLIKEFRRKERDHFRLLREGVRRNKRIVKEAKLRAKKTSDENPSSGPLTGSTLAPPSLALVIRIKSMRVPTDEKTRTILSTLRLVKDRAAVFVKLNPAVEAMLEIAKPFITWGRPNMNTIRTLITKRGMTKNTKDGKPIPISNNVVIEEKLGSKGMICVDDLIHEVCTLGPNFNDVNNFLCNFILDKPDKAFPSKRLHFRAGGAHGDRGAAINDLVKVML